jgi:cysteine desulfurase/selenocysteine lyase
MMVAANVLAEAPSRKTFDVARIRRDFPTLRDDESFLDSVASSLTPTCVVDAMSEYYNRYRANVHRGTYDLSLRASEYYERGLQAVARFIHAKPTEIVFTQNTTAAINLVAQTLKWSPGDEILVSSIEHTSNMLPWFRLTYAAGVKLRFYNPGREGNFDLNVLESMINERTRLVSMTFVSNVLGCVVPVAEIARICKRKKVLFLVDAAQAAPHLPVDVEAIGCDFLAFSGHKMLGPTGVGVLYIREELAARMVPAALGGGTITTGACACSSVDACQFSLVTFAELPWKWQAGTPPIAEVIGLGRAVEYLEDVGLDAVEAHDRDLTRRALIGLREISGVEIFGPLDPEAHCAIISFNIADLLPVDVGRTLNERFKIAVRAGDHCALAYFKEIQSDKRTWGNVRASFYLYNTQDDVDRLLGAVEKIANSCQ